MGNIFLSGSRARVPHDSLTDTEVMNLKLEAAKITEFHGRIDDFQAWRIRTECALDGSGFEKILTNSNFAHANPRMNRIVFSQLSVATANGDAYHLVLKHNETKDGNGAWNELLEWYDGDAVRSETADTLRAKLHNLKLRDPIRGSQYINSFNQYMHHLDRIQGEAMSESHKIQIFIRNIEDEDYMDVALHLRNSEVLSLDKAISAIRKRERDLKEIKVKRKPPFLTRRIDHTEIAPEWANQAQSTPNLGRPIRRLEIVRLTQGGYIKPPKGTWYTDDMPADHKAFVQEWNSKVAHGEDTGTISIPKGITVLPPRNKWAHKARRLAEQASPSPAITPSPTKITGKRAREETSTSFGKKRISFGLDSSTPDDDE
jgi:hypothetical protein